MRFIAICAALVATLLFTGQPAECAWCANAPCMTSSTCPSGCLCSSGGPGQQGSCYAPRLATQEERRGSSL